MSAEWEYYLDDFANPYGEDSFKRVPESEPERKDESVFRLYFKGLVRLDNVGSGEVPLEGIGVAICDQRDNLVHELKKNGKQANARMAELKALSEGLELAISFGLQRIKVCCDNYTVFQLVKGRWTAKQRKIAILLNHISLLLNKFKHPYVSLVRSKNVKFAFSFAREAIILRKESCDICLEDIDSVFMITVDGCSHRYCCSCMNKHVKGQMFHGMLPKCPHQGCKSYISIDRCGIFLNSTLMEKFKNLIVEAAIPVTDKFYCPYPQCSALMSKTKVVEHSRKVFDECFGAGKCIQCNSIFCIDCKVPWHTNMTCADYKRSNPEPLVEEMKLKSLASLKQWRQCVKCQHMIELSEGCCYLTCRCGHEFCYKCGAGWKDKIPTCNCRLWDEHELISEDEFWEAEIWVEELIWEGENWGVDLLEEEQIWEGGHQIF